MAWFKLAGDGAFHAKVLEAGNEAYGAWCRAGQWSSAHLTEGHIPRAVALTIAEANVWQKLSKAQAGGEHGLVDEVDGGWQIHDYLDWNPSAAEERAKRDARVSAGKRGGSSRAAKQSVKQDAKQTTSKPEATGQPKSKPVSVLVSVDPESTGEVDPGPDTTAREAPPAPPIQPPPTPAGPLAPDRSVGGRLAAEAAEFEQAVNALAADLARVPAFERDDHRAFAEDLLSGARMQGASLDDARKGIAAAIFKRGRELRKAGPLERQRIIGTFVSKQKTISAQDKAEAERRARASPPRHRVQGAGDLDLERINRESEERARAANEEAAEGF